MRIFLPLTGALLGLVLAGCGGFQPREALDLPGSVRVQGGSYELRHALESRLDGSGARLAGKDADLVLAVRPGGFDERLLSVEPVRGKAREYQIAFQVRYTLKDGKGEQVIEPGEVKVVREYRVHRGERLSRTREQGVIHDEMRREAAAAIVRRLHATSGG
jgi:outer membrane lipopolysaccharide assembly protein LptE/RlpB